MQDGISVTEACASNRIGTKEDFERSCNPDGTVKEHTETTAFSLKNSNNSKTINNTYLQIGIAMILIAVVILVALAIRKKNLKLIK